MCQTTVDSASSILQHARNSPSKQDACSPPVVSHTSYRRRRQASRGVAIALLCVLVAAATVACGWDGTCSWQVRGGSSGGIAGDKRLAEFGPREGRTIDGRRRQKLTKQQHPDATETQKTKNTKKGRHLEKITGTKSEKKRPMRKRRAVWRFLVRLFGRGGGDGSGVVTAKGGKGGAVDELRARLLEDLKRDLDGHPGDLRRRAKAVGIELNDCILSRYLEMAFWTMEWAGRPLVEAIDSTVRWREEARPHLITDRDVMEEAEHGKMFVRGHDREGRPIIHYSPGRERNFDTKKALNLLFHTLEKAATMLPRGQTQFAVVADCSDFWPSKTPPLAMIKSAMFTMQQHYPMRLGYVVIVNAGGPITLVWKLVSAVLHDRTKEKIVFLTKKEAAERLSRHIDPSNLHSSLPGGVDPFRYSNELYLSTF